MVSRPVGGDGRSGADGRRPRAWRARRDPRPQGHRSTGVARCAAPVVQRAHGDRRRHPSRRPGRRQLRALRTRRVTRARYVVVAPAGGLARSDRALPLRCRPHLVAGDEAPAQGVVAPAARPQLPLGVGCVDACRHRRHGCHERGVPGGRHGVDDGGSDGRPAPRPPRPLCDAHCGGSPDFSRRGQERRERPTTTGSPDQ